MKHANASYPHKGKDERAVGYVKRDAIARREFASWADLQAHSDRWCRDIADVRIHGTTGQQPIGRFEQIEHTFPSPIRPDSPAIDQAKNGRGPNDDAAAT